MNNRLVLLPFEIYGRSHHGKRGSVMENRERQSGTTAEARKAYEAPRLESLGSLESHTQVGVRAGGGADRGSS